MSTDVFGIPTGPLDREPDGYLPGTEREALLRRILADAGVQLGRYDEAMVAWLADWDWSTFAAITSLIQRAASGVDHTPQTS